MHISHNMFVNLFVLFFSTSKQSFEKNDSFIYLSSQLSNESSTHLKELHGMMSADGTLLQLHNPRFLQGGGHLNPLLLNLNETLEVQEIALVVNLVQL